jgi:hypothetical protein
MFSINNGSFDLEILHFYDFKLYFRRYNIYIEYIIYIRLFSPIHFSLFYILITLGIRNCKYLYFYINKLQTLHFYLYKKKNII